MTEHTDEATPEWGPWIAYNGGGCPDECVGKRVEICTGDNGNSGLRNASIIDWHKSNIVAYRTKREPVVKVWVATHRFSLRPPFHDGRLVDADVTPSVANLHVRISLTETDGVRTITAEEVAQ